MKRVVIGVDPHKLSATIEVVDQQENLLGSGRFTTDKAGFAAMRKYVNQWPEREWAVEGSLGVGRPLAQRLMEAGERVVDVPAKLAARARLLDTGHGRKTDAHDAHSVAVAAVRAKNLCVLAPDAASDRWVESDDPDLGVGQLVFGERGVAQAERHTEVERGDKNRPKPFRCARRLRLRRRRHGLDVR
jgi:hypothetical protein